MNSNLVYILFDKTGDCQGVYSSHSYAVSEAVILNLKDWYILAREYK